MNWLEKQKFDVISYTYFAIWRSGWKALFHVSDLRSDISSGFCLTPSWHITYRVRWIGEDILGQWFSLHGGVSNHPPPNSQSSASHFQQASDNELIIYPLKSALNLNHIIFFLLHLTQIQAQNRCLINVSYMEKQNRVLNLVYYELFQKYT